ncbi:PREDICTED: uncharacterized protein LOC107327498 [Acropora digitifera]|uniref:uncharacterized protein LOC107327498 n=1 Tax=Acropora digitifera TaxID=70779 RepID=UPI00077AF42E|nr:PREDICTED: uncharacterized protein LOC107327498 [Acropora digitifera]
MKVIYSHSWTILISPTFFFFSFFLFFFFQDSVKQDIVAPTNGISEDEAPSKRSYTVKTRYGKIRVSGAGRKPNIAHICFSKNWRKRVDLRRVCLSLRDEASSSSGPFFIPSVGAGWEGRENYPRNMVGDEDDT